MFDPPDDTAVRDPDTCWKNRTPFQMALILILAVAVPFLITLLIVYILSLTPSLRASGECSRLCNVFADWKKSRNPKQLTDYPDSYDNTKSKRSIDDENFADFTTGDVSNLKRNRSKRKTQCSEDGLDFPQIAALLETLYTDDEEQIFKCSVAVLSTNLVLTIEECLSESLSVRINSNRWSKGGSLKKVDTVFKLDKMAVLHLEADPNRDECFTPARISEDNKSPIAKLFFWNGKLNRPLNRRKKFEILQSADVRVDRGEFSCQDCSEEIGSPLLDENRSLIGFQTSRFNYTSLEGYSDWLKFFFK